LTQHIASTACDSVQGLVLSCIEDLYPGVQLSMAERCSANVRLCWHLASYAHGQLQGLRLRQGTHGVHNHHLNSHGQL
jgi:hypothetical protein